MINWQDWQPWVGVPAWKACVLSLDQDPKRILLEFEHQFYNYGDDADSCKDSYGLFSQDYVGFGLCREFRRRLVLLTGYLNQPKYFSPLSIHATNQRRSEIRISEFAAWSKDVGLQIPRQLSERAASPEIIPAGIVRPIEKSASTRERENLLRTIAGLAKKGYGYDPDVRNTAIKDMVSDLNDLEISISEQTIRNYINEGINLLVGRKPA
jgi:hypothetical protein